MPRVHVLGGGPSALAAAYDLVKKSTLDVTIYTAGWRLGGKCASGMGFLERNEEHGLHLPLGFYENFFDQVRSAYQDVSADLRFPSWDKAFTKRNTVVVEQQVEGQWFEWSFGFPDRSATSHQLPGDLAGQYMAGNPAAPSDLERLAQRILDRALQVATGLAVSEVEGLAAIGKRLLAAVGGAVGDLSADDKMKHLTAAHQDLRQGLANVSAAGKFAALKTRVYVELGLAGGHALLDLHERKQSLSSIDNLDLIEWLDRFAPVGGRLSDETRNSAPLKMAYELVFAYQNGDTARPRLAAGVGARGILRLLFGYQGAFAYDVEAGMGECAITPYFLALQKSGRVTFQFFSRLTGLEVTNGRVASFTLRRQATLKGPQYSPLSGQTNTQWPATPLYDQLEDGNVLAAGEELSNGGFDLESSYSASVGVGDDVVQVPDGDFVVLAVPSPELTGIPVNFGPNQALWNQMLANVTGVATLSAQLWLNCSFKDLGWPPTGIDVPDPALIGAFIDPLGNIADMSRLIPQEGWQDPSRKGAEDIPVGLLFLCGVFKDDAPPPPAGRPAAQYIADAEEKARQILAEWVANAAPAIMPNIGGDKLYVPSEVAGGNVPAIRRQYAGANVGPAHRYITSFPGTITARIPPDCRQPLGAANLLLAGDWTDNGFNAGCLEAAVTSGRMAARAVMGKNYPIYGENDARW
jgi:uncharacterized protein with NAD-binding domain and iron-sulfur cluster